MKYLPALAALVLLVSPASAQSGLLRDAEEPAEPPRFVRIQLRLFEVSLADLAHINAAPTPALPDMYASVQRMCAGGRARLIHLAALAVGHGHKATTESVREMTYPTEYEPPGLPLSPEMQKKLEERMMKSALVRPHGACPVAFETRNAGDTLEIEPTIRDDGKHIDLRLAYERVSHLRDITWLTYRDRWGTTNNFFPEFGTIRPTVAVTLAHNRMQFIATLSPPGGNSDRRILLFAKARVMTP